jgi:hypothetical protein
MKTFKLVDFWVSIGLIVSFLIASLIKQDETVLFGYCIVGAWQIISMLVHAWSGWFCEKGSSRYNYHVLVIILLAISLSGFVFYVFIFMLMYLMVFAAPIMAIYYTWLCYNEVYVKMIRPLAVLK